MFKTFTRSILAGILLTQVSRQRRVETSEAAVMEDEELFLSSQIEHWIEYLDFPTASDTLQMIGDRSGPTGDFAEKGQDDSAVQDADEDAADILGAEISLHGAVLANLERMQEDLSELIGKWRAASTPTERTEDETEDED